MLHGQRIRYVDIELIGREDTLLWLSRGDLKGETGSELMAAHEQEFQNKYLATNILQTETESKCKL